MNAKRGTLLNRGFVLAGVLAGLTMCGSARADDPWHNVYHSLKHFFTGKSGSSPTPSVHHHAKQTTTHHAKTDENSETGATSSPSPSVSPAQEEVPATTATPSATHPRVVVLPAATQESSVQQDAAQTSSSAQTQATPNPSPGAPVKENGLEKKPDPGSETGPVLRSLEKESAGAAGNPTP